MTFLQSLILAIRLVSIDSTTTAENACNDRWDEDTDGWHECFCALETWRCEAQGWCSEPGGEPDLLGIGLPTTHVAGCQ